MEGSTEPGEVQYENNFQCHHDGGHEKRRGDRKSKSQELSMKGAINWNPEGRLACTIWKLNFFHTFPFMMFALFSQEFD